MLTGDHNLKAGRATGKSGALFQPPLSARLKPLSQPQPHPHPTCTPTLGLGVNLQEVVLWGDVGPEHLVLQRPAEGGQGGGGGVRWGGVGWGGGRIFVCVGVSAWIGGWGCVRLATVFEMHLRVTRGWPATRWPCNIYTVGVVQGTKSGAWSRSRVEPRAAAQLLSLSKLSRCMLPLALTA